MFSVVRGVLLQPLPYRDPARLVDVLDSSVKDPNLSHTFAAYGDFEEYALHARSRDIVRLVAIQGGVSLLAGLAMGLLLTVALTGYLRSLLFEVSPGDPVATARPARTAVRADPMTALRDE